MSFTDEFQLRVLALSFSLDACFKTDFSTLMDRDSSPEGHRLPPGFRFRRVPLGLSRSTTEHLHISPTRYRHQSSSPDSHAPHSPARPFSRPSRRPSAERRPAADDEASVIRQFREFDARYGEANRTNMVRSRRRNSREHFRDYEDWNVAELFGSPNRGGEGEGAVGYSIPRARRYADDSEDEADRHRAIVEYHTRTFIGRSLINSKLETKKLVLLAVLRLKVRSPNLTSESAWQQTVEWLRREHVIERDSEADTLWTYAFGEAPQDHFNQIWSSSVTAIRDLWADLRTIF